MSSSDSQQFIIGTEIGLVDRLRIDHPSKQIIPALTEAICIQQKKITTYNLYLSLVYERYQIKIPEYTVKMEREQNKIKADVLRGKKISQEVKDRLDYLEALESANRWKVKDPAKAVKFYERAMWEKEVGFVD